jgi:hypothetical protein
MFCRFRKNAYLCHRLAEATTVGRSKTKALQKESYYEKKTVYHCHCRSINVCDGGLRFERRQQGQEE